MAGWGVVVLLVVVVLVVVLWVLVGSVVLAVLVEVAPLEEPEYYQFPIDTAKVTELWRRGSVVSSWLLDLTAAVTPANVPTLAEEWEDEGIWGIAFGQLYGHAKSRGFQGRNTQDTRMGSLYWGRLLEESRRARWTFKGSLTWAETHNKMTSRLGGAPAFTGKWNNETWLAQAEVSRTADYAGGWRLTPFLRVEFTHGRQDAFREQGGYGRDFGGAALKHLSIPVGLEIGRTDEWKGRPWAQALRVSYVGDVLQDVPEGTVYSPYSDMGWRGRAVSPERHGLRAEYNTFLQCNERWSVYGGYGLEVRGSSCYHRVNAGVSRSF